MSSQTQPTVSVQEDRVVIENAEIEDSEVVDHFTDIDPDERGEALKRALRVGVVTLELAETSGEEEYVERRFEELRRDLETEIDRIEDQVEEKFGDNGHVPQTLETHFGDDGKLREHIEDAFGEDGVFVERLDKELGEDGERIRKALDPDNEGSPTYRLEQRLKDEIESIKEQVIEEEKESEMRSQTYFKGGDFEDSLHQILEEIVRQTPNNVEFTGDTPGEIGRDVGDFVITLADTGQNIVVEAKTESYSLQDIKDEMEEAMQNRDAAYGLFVTDTLANLPRTKTGWFHEFPEQNTVVVAMSETDDQDLEPGYLRIAFNWARMRSVQAYAEFDSDFDPEELRSELSEIEEDISQFKTIRGQCTEIRKSRERIEETLDNIEQSIKNRLAEIEAQLTKADNQ
ncbi:hypothetical protein DV733_09280 [Halapricum salinum]|uniref:Uncharacterized protein n=2 Tax=Halapricum salinum TaxID=1457250 RepID=A0A4D6HCY4_9EURY|nr:hypothetical protein DV733_09280 [Halapricum salinum]